jgi:hypothetical protein
MYELTVACVNGQQFVVGQIPSCGIRQLCSYVVLLV